MRRLTAVTASVVSGRHRRLSASPASSQPASTYTRWAWTNEGRFTVFAALLLVGLAGGIGGARVIGKRSEPGG